MNSAADSTGRWTAASSASFAELIRPRLCEQIVEKLHLHIQDQGLKPGDQLPAERELAQALGVSRASLTQALVALEVVGVVQVRHGELATILQSPTEGDVLLRAVCEHQDSLADIINARSALEAKLAWLAAEQRTDEDLRVNDKALPLIQQQVDRLERELDEDRAFYEAVKHAGHSVVLARLMTEISRLILETRIKSLSQPARPRESLAQHRQIACATRRRDSVGAALAMTTHTDRVTDVALVRHADFTSEKD